MKGIILAGGNGTRLYPSTISVTKQLLPVFDKPMIYYPLSTLMLMGIREILLICKSEDLSKFKKLFGDGTELGISIQYAIQDVPKGLVDAFIIGEEFINGDSVCLILGDNLFYGHELIKQLQRACNNNEGATVFGYPVSNPEEFGVVEFDANNNVISIEEKPQRPKSNYAIPGLYIYDKTVIDLARKVKPSPRGELEITALNELYLLKHKLKVILLGRGIAWMDTGTPISLLQASEYVRSIQSKQGLYIACIEEVAYNMGYINKLDLKKLADKQKGTAYGEYILKVLSNEKYSVSG